MLPLRGAQWLGRRTFCYTYNPRASHIPNPDAPLTGAAKLLADAIEEESRQLTTSSRDHLRLTQGPVWDGDESAPDAVLRMLVDAHKPLRSGQGVKHNSADEKIKGWMKGLKLEPREPPPRQEPIPLQEPIVPHRTTIPPHLHRPWHATYTGDSRIQEAPKIKFGTFIKSKADGDSLTNLLELQLPPNADGKTRARVRALRKAGKVVRRVENAREGALDYKLGLTPGEVGPSGDDETFGGNRQVKGSSVLGTQKGGASGLRAWSGLVEDRIQRAKESGFFNVTKGKGKPIPRDPEAGNPHLDSGELLMNRIVKRQGALPPWIELQNNLDSSVASFRNTLLQTYTTHVVRSVISTTSLVPLPPSYTIPSRDEAWEARELKFHQESIKQINDQVRRMNALAPSPARRHLYTLDMELDRVRGDNLKSEVWNEIKRRAAENQFRADTKPTSLSPAIFDSGGFHKLRAAANRSLSTIARPVQSVIGRSTSHGASSTSEPHVPNSTSQRGGLFGLVAVGLGIAALVYSRRPLDNESPDPHPPVQGPSIVAEEAPSGVLHLLHTYIFEPISTFFRFCHLVLLFGPVIITAPMLLVGRPQRRRRLGKPVAVEEENWGAVWWYGFLVKQMERAGPSFIKLGQWAASRADIFPASLCDKMSKLHSNGAPHSLKHTKAIITHAYGLNFNDIFEEFEPKPIGCGAIAQVYRAKLKPEFYGISPDDHDDSLSTSVAIKVLHPHVRKTIRRDIAIMSIFANVINAFPGMIWLSLPEEVAVFGEMMNSQLDLRVEAANLDRFDANFRKRGRMVTFPRPIDLGKGTNGEPLGEAQDVMIEEYENALPLKWFLQNGGGPYDDKIANIGLDAFLEMLLLDNWTHGDLHPGNIMVRFYKPSSRDYLGPLIARFSKNQTVDQETIPKPSVSADELVESLSTIAHDREKWLERLDELHQEGFAPQLIFIDAGLVTSLDDTNRRNFLELFQAIAEFDGYKAGKLMVERCRTPENVLDEETFALKIQHLVLSVKSKTFSLAKIKISDILTDVLTAVRQHHVKLEGDFVNTVISILLLEGIGRQLDPNMDLFKSALPILRQLGRQLGTREAITMVPKGNIWAMAKVWVWIEARQVAGEVSAIDDWVKYDRFAPAI